MSTVKSMATIPSLRLYPKNVHQTFALTV